MFSGEKRVERVDASEGEREVRVDGGDEGVDLSEFGESGSECGECVEMMRKEGGVVGSE